MAQWTVLGSIIKQSRTFHIATMNRVGGKQQLSSFCFPEDERQSKLFKLETVGFRYSLFELRTSTFELRYSLFEIRTSLFVIQTSNLDIRSSSFELRTSNLVNRTSNFEPRTSKHKRSPSEHSPKDSFSSKNGGYLLSHGCAVPSARSGLTSLFGMGRGGTPTL